MKKVIRLTESDLHHIVKNTVRRIVKESSNPYWGNDEDEKIRKRNDNYVDDVYGDGPSVYDTMEYEDNPEMMDTRIALNRRTAHNTHPDSFEDDVITYDDEYDNDMYESTNRKKSVKLSESELHSLIKETVKKVINEVGDTPKGQKALGALHARQEKKANDTDHRKNPKEWSKNMIAPAKTYNHAFNKAKGNESKWGNKSFSDKDHPYNQGYEEYKKANESKNRMIKNIVTNTINRLKK